ASERYSRNFSRNGAREKIIPAYMGLIKQIDDQLGHLFSFMQDQGLMGNTMIVFTSDHGDFLGDHWMGEKYLFHDPSAKVPMIIYDPDASADSTRGTTSDALVEMIDLAPTFVDIAGGIDASHILEGRSLMPLLRGENPDWRNYVFSEFDFAAETVRLKLNLSVQNSRLTMAFDGRFKLIECHNMRPMLFDLKTDPKELVDLGADPAHKETCNRLIDAIHSWYRNARNRITATDATFTQDDKLMQAGGDPVLQAGIVIGYWDEAELNEEQKRLRKFNPE
ncbi:sulfatase/phosphatase domain-containing protein, partial [Cochlodiniinecator piscidefendens]|uniref:sulfatase/phosphatase domain-containing protein n=1 Tax=Cochlodiniinecator piscidefendens TaxID=2715756 RepID=UPI00140A6386